MPFNSLSRNLLSVVQFEIHYCFKTEVRPQNPHTLVPKLALVDTVQTPVVGIWNGLAKRMIFTESEKNWTWNVFANFELDVGFLVQESKEKREFCLGINLSEEKRETDLDLE